MASPRKKKKDEYVLRTLHESLEEDTWRVDHPFSDDMLLAQKVTNHAYASDYARAKAVRLWLHRNQPCLFGRVAAKTNIHICVLSEDDLNQSDAHVREKVQGHREQWKLRSSEADPPEHGFVLCALSNRLLYAQPNGQLLKFAIYLRNLYAPEVVKDLEGNDIAWETLYLRKPDTDEAMVFRFSVDFFAAAGDQRWWHDHRIPGGIAFTANSVGHMVKSREWYTDLSDQAEWALGTAMETVHLAQHTEWGKAIWLRKLNGKKTRREGSCPFKNIRRNLQDMDWTSYSGRLSTDHSLRKEIFKPSAAPPESDVVWNMDLRYLFDRNAADYENFMGRPVTASEVESVLGKPGERRILAAFPESSRLGVHASEIDALLAKMEAEWGDRVG